MIAVVDYHKGNLKSVERGLAAVGGDARITDDVDVIARADAIVLPGVGAFADAAATMAELGQMEAVRARVDAGVPFLGICLGEHLMFEEGEEGAPEVGEGEEPRRPRGLAILPGVVGRMPRVDAAGRAYKVPHVGWNAVVPAGAGAGALGVAGGGSKAQSLGQSCSHGSAAGASGSCGTRLVSTAPAPGDEAVPCAVVPSGSGQAEFACPLFDGVAPGEFFYFTHSYVAPDTPATVAVTTHSVTFPCAVQYRDRVFGVQFHPEKSSDAGAKVLANFVRIVGEI
ncbi:MULTISPECIES: imidazole glycerol phosphate synthase subunit HisH [unclassified Adlercreutzia]|uniref:imidazole glycerol phosphate synthase subunit HisH n=1 Tax=unclassified Adlercreutzia TaxID=2636013 RepID=UPI0013EA2D2D|nr:MULTISPECIES: imidazole glycerol phosphate synthase subunit HisH [unclassified Adlercreutzia]